MSTRRGNDMNDGGVFNADTSAKVDPTKDLNDESKAEWLKRRNAEDRKHKAGLKIKDEWYEVTAHGTKLVKKLRKNNGGVYSLYMGKTKKADVKAFMATLKKDDTGKYRPKNAGAKS
jgi:hypothetical protein